MTAPGGQALAQDTASAVMPGNPASSARPGDFDFDDFAFQTDPWSLYEWHRRHAPVSWSDKMGTYAVLGYQNVRHALTSPDFVVSHPFRNSRRAMGPTMLDSDGKAHLAPRRCALESLRPRAIPDLVSQVIEPVVATVIDVVLAERPADLAQRVARCIPINVICRVLGLPDSDVPWLYSMIRPLVFYVDRGPVPLAEVAWRRRELCGYFREALESGSGNGMLATLATDEQLSAVDAVNNAVLLLAAGTETTTASICNLFARLATTPRLFQDLAADRALIPAAVAETLRHEPPLHMTLRFAAREVTMAGTTLPPGAAVQVFLASANRDPDVYPDPEVWRLRDGAPLPLGFGAGPHVCLGMSLARAELEAVLAATLDRITELSVIGPEPVVRGRTIRAASELELDYGLRPPGGRAR
jgi:cytochrome P450